MDRGLNSFATVAVVTPLNNRQIKKGTLTKEYRLRYTNKKNRNIIMIVV